MTNSTSFLNFDPNSVPSPCFVVDEIALENNLRILAHVQQASGAKVLLALKAFSMFSLAPLISRYLQGTCASGLYEAKLGAEEFGGEVHTYSAAFTESDLKQVLEISHHVVFNSFSQWEKYKPLAQAAAQQRPELRFGLRINPQHSEGTTTLYDPCAPGSRLGIPKQAFLHNDIDGISGLHFHTLCEQNTAPLARTLAAVEEHFGELLHQLEWVNFGGGHHITHKDYDVDALITLIKNFKQKYNVKVYLEPGEAIAINTGVLVSEVLDITYTTKSTTDTTKIPLAILDTSATCHMPDTLEMPYRAHIFHTAEAHEKNMTYRVGGQTCLAGDVMGDYSVDTPLTVGQRLIFDDMAHYTMVKTHTFNGIPLPSIAIWNSETHDINVIRQFSYGDFKNRLS